MKYYLIIVLTLFTILYSCEAFLRIQNKEFFYNNDKVFLSGVNIPWWAYGRDFGSGAYANSRNEYEKRIDEISNSGGNAIRVWVHIDGQWSPKFDSNGFATGADTPLLIQELRTLLDHAQQKNILVIFCLWNLAVKPQQMIHLYTQPAQLQSYLDKVLRPLVLGLKDHKALGAWDIINEPFGSVSQGVGDPEPCWDTNILKGTGTDWTASHLHLKDVMRFVNLHADVIKTADPKALVTVGDGDQTSTIVCGAMCREYWSDHCLQISGGKPKGTLDFYQLHTYTWQNKFPANSPFKHHNNDYKSNKPLLIGEFSTDGSESKNASLNYRYLYDSGYAGALNWAYREVQADSDIGMNAIKNLTINGKVRIIL